MVNWDDASQKQLLFTVIHLLGVPNPKWEDVAAAMGEGFTASAVKQQFNKLRNDAKKQFGEIGKAGIASPNTPNKRGAQKGSAEASKSAGKRKATKAGVEGEGAGAGEMDDDDDDDDEHSPSKKVKKEELEELEDDED